MTALSSAANTTTSVSAATVVETGRTVASRVKVLRMIQRQELEALKQKHEISKKNQESILQNMNHVDIVATTTKVIKKQ